MKFCIKIYLLQISNEPDIFAKFWKDLYCIRKYREWKSWKILALVDIPHLFWIYKELVKFYLTQKYLAWYYINY